MEAELIACIFTKRPGPSTKAVHGQLAGGHEDVGVGLVEPASEPRPVQNDHGGQQDVKLLNLKGVAGPFAETGCEQFE